MSDTQQERAQQLFQAGKIAFERGDYRNAIEYLEKAAALVPQGSRLGGEAQVWLVTSYEANGMRQDAIALCSKVSRHPIPSVAKQGRRILYILQAPRLKLRPEWMTQIPDLGTLQDSNRDDVLEKYRSTTKRRRRKKVEDEPVVEDLSKMNTKDNQFVWLALGVIVLVLGGLAWFST